MCGSCRSKKNVEVAIVGGRSRSAFAKSDFKPGDFVCKYISVVREKEDKHFSEITNEDLGVRCYCLNAPYNGEVYRFDATPKINHPG